MLRCAVPAIVGFLAWTSPAGACEVVARDALTLPGLVQASPVIVRALAEGLGDGAPRPGAIPVATRVRFRVLNVYKGSLDSDVIELNGVLMPATRYQVAYNRGRPRSATPSCYNPTYAVGAVYLLLLGPDDGLYSPAGDLTPYWTPQQPTNERLVGNDDPWLAWVMRALGLTKYTRPTLEPRRTP